VTRGLHPEGLAHSGLARPVPDNFRRLGGALAHCLVPFVILATLNSGGYRYGASDQAFYQPAVTRQLDPSLFPRDTPVLAAQTHLTLADEAIASIVRVTGASVPIVFFALYVVALTLFATGAWVIGRHVYAGPWTAVALLAAFTLRHAIARVQHTIEDDDWGRVMAWARKTGKGSGWLADPLHADGTSVRVAGERDVFVEAVKDTALGMYDRDIAVRTDTRLRELAYFSILTPETARELGTRYDLDYLVTERTLDLPLAFGSGALRVYRLR